MDDIPSRRTVLQVLGGSGVTGLAGCVGLLDDDDTDPSDEGTDDQHSTVRESKDSEGRSFDISEQREFTAAVPDAVALEPVVTGLEQPTDIVFVPGRNIRYVSTRAGLVHVHDETGLRDEPLLDHRGEVELGGERGFLGLALHPDFETNGRLFARYSGQLREKMPEDYTHTFVVSEFGVGEDLRSVDADTERYVMEIPQPQEYHNAGGLAFGPDGYLYVPTGDGGKPNDLAPDHPEDWYDGNEGGNGQDTRKYLHGGVLRIDVDVEDDEGYAVPPDNPLVDEEGHRDEYYAWGMRNPFRLSFDGDDLYVGVVGQAQWEWVDRVEKGGNYGWNVKEGSHCFDADDRFNVVTECPDGTPDDVRGGERLRDPVLEYPNARNPRLDVDEYESGIGVIGGHVYRGSAIPELEGLYVFGDIQVNGRLFVGQPLEDYEDVPWPMTTLPLTDDGADQLQGLTAIEEDEDGELYAVGRAGVYRLLPDA